MVPEMAIRVADHITLSGRDGDAIEVPVRVSARARRMLLKVDPARGGPELVVPAGVAMREAEAFARRNLGWLEVRLARMPRPVPFADGALIPILGREHVLRHAPQAGRGGWIEPSEDAVRPPALVVSGRAEHLPRRARDWLIGHARRHVVPRAKGFAETLDAKVGRIALRDTRTRWGSCSSRGDLSFSWRLVMAPESVLDYVCAHEAAHLIEMNHSPRFWRLVDRLVPDVQSSRAWLKRHGGHLHRYG
jgi:predicted metal-dependent hydrolase